MTILRIITRNMDRTTYEAIDARVDIGRRIRSG
jgi:hypothetical protein